MPVQILSAEIVRELFDYAPESGILTRRPCAGTNWRFYPITRSRDGDRGYIKTTVNKRSYFVHRLVWAYVYGVWPALEIDHINRNPSDNRVENLRDVSRATNLLNRTLRAKEPKRLNETKRRHVLAGSGSVFMAKQARVKMFRARVQERGVRINLGYYMTPDEAWAAIALHKLGPVL